MKLPGMVPGTIGITGIPIFDRRFRLLIIRILKRPEGGLCVGIEYYCTTTSTSTKYLVPLVATSTSSILISEIRLRYYY